MHPDGYLVSVLENCGARDLGLVVVGAGFAGLAAARTFLDAGVKFRLFEAENGPGGLLRTDTVGAFSDVTP